MGISARESVPKVYQPNTLLAQSLGAGTSAPPGGRPYTTHHTVRNWNALGRLARFCCLLLLVSCGGPKGPQATLRAYLEHLSAGRSAEAFELLCDRSRAELADLEERWRAGEEFPEYPYLAGEEALVDDDSGTRPGFLFFQAAVGLGKNGSGTPLPLPLVPEFIGIEQRDNRTVIRIQTPLGYRETSLVRDEDGYRILLDI